MKKVPDAVKVMVIALVVVGAGFYLFNYDEDRSLGQAGMVINRACKVVFSDGKTLAGVSRPTKNADKSITSVCVVGEPR